MFVSTAGGPSGGGIVVALALAAIAAEAVSAARLGRRIHDRGESTATVIVALGHFVARLAEAGLVTACLVAVWAHRAATIEVTGPVGAAALFFGFEFLYYWYHRAAHRVRWLWATHAVHHSTRRFNLTAALRLGWTGAITGHFLFFAPLVLVGFSPRAVLTMAAVDLAWQFFVHTELVPRLGPLEAVLNTPRHHAVHHASNPACIDRNFGGMLIVFDRMFGTFAAPPEEPLRFGLVGHDPGTSVVAIVFGEWRRLVADVVAAPSPAAAFGCVFGPPSEAIASRHPLEQETSP